MAKAKRLSDRRLGALTGLLKHANENAGLNIRESLALAAEVAAWRRRAKQERAEAARLANLLYGVVKTLRADSPGAAEEARADIRAAADLLLKLTRRV